jgi:N-acetylglutamate synthase-like GNAT family acetyltransferase
MTDFSIRTAKPDDHASVDEVLRQSYTTLMPRGYSKDILQPALPLMARANPVLLNSGTYYVVQTENHIVIGCGGWSPERPGNGEVKEGLGHIRHFATHPDWLGRGIGSMIFHRCVEDALAAEIREFECYSSLNAEQFYAALGFTRVKLVDIQMGPDIQFPSVLMRQQIPGY